MSKKMSESKTTKGNTATPKISKIFRNNEQQSPQSMKCSSSILSPSEADPINKKPNTSSEEKNVTPDLVQLLDPLLSQFKSLRESVDNKVG